MARIKKEVNTEDKITPRKRSPKYSKCKGSNYELKIARELRELGFPGIVTARSESKSADANKVDLIDTKNQLNLGIQLKRTQNTPNYFKIREESTINNEDFVLIWSREEKKEVNICSVGEVVFVDKNFFYKLIKKYYLENTN